MISIPVDSIGTVMAKDRSASSLKEWLAPTIILGVILFFANHFSGQLDNVQKKLESHGESIARFDERLKVLNERYYKAIAMASGIKDPQIIEASLKTNEKFSTKTPTSIGDVFIIYTIIGYDPIQKVLRIGFDGRIGTITYEKNMFIITNVEPGTMVSIPSLTVGQPQLFVQILELPSPNKAILAIGPKTYSTGKTS